MVEKNKVSNGSVNWLLFFNIILYVIITEAVIIVNSYINYDEPDTYATRIIVQLFAILLPVVIFTYSKKIKSKDFYKFNRLNFKNVCIIAALGICSQFIGVVLKLFIKVIFVIFKIPYTVNSQSVSAGGSGSEVMMSVIALVLLPAVAEELLFRGLVLRSYEKWGTRSAIIISSLLFGLLHLDISSILATVFMGLLLAYVVVKTDSIFAGIILHLVNNGTALLSIFVVSKLSYLPQFIWVVVFIIAIAAFFPLFSLFNKNNIQTKYIPQKRTVSSEITRTVFTLPILLSLMAFIIIQLYIFDIF